MEDGSARKGRAMAGAEENLGLGFFCGSLMPSPKFFPKISPSNFWP